MMNPHQSRKVQPLHPDFSQMQGLDTHNFEAFQAMDTVSVAPERVGQYTDAQLVGKWMLLDALLLVAGLVALISLTVDVKVSSAVLLSANLLTSMVGTRVCRYYVPSESRHSLGKAMLLAAGLWMMNVVLLAAGFHYFDWMTTALLLLWFSLKALLSGYWHHEMGFQYSESQAKSIYYRLELWIKRAFDCVWVGGGMLCLSPLLISVGLLLAVEEKGSPIFCQVRVGKGERFFNMYKFRSMVKSAAAQLDSNVAVLYKRADDPRITAMGRIIRKWSIDELPQLWNVLKGDMSLVGPRPPLPHEYDQMNWYHRRKFEAVPGLTGLWQVVGRVKNQRDFNAVAAYDVYYIENWSLAGDLKILFKTIPVVLLHRGAC